MKSEEKYEALMHNPHFARYYRTWEKNELSIVFVPLAQICREQGLLTEAQEICKRGLTHHPHSVSGRLLLARIHYDLDQYEDAKKIVEEILSELPAQREAQTLLGRLKRCCGTFQNSQMQSGGSSAPLWENVTMAKIYAGQGEIKIARQIVEKILSRDPQNQRALQLREEWKR